ncbi:YggS family pyridoxal phosphate-dependent enzyme [Pelagibacteraceae bacterium]|nr:YggS family pyridoxal phosphate-dependent enzyme [Pelagibacteraceae bacterium]
MNNIVQNFLNIRDKLTNTNLNPTVIAVSKTFPLGHIKPLIDHGHRVFGENKVQEAKQKWSGLKDSLKDLELHLIGGLQSNKSKEAVQLFDYIHSVDSIKLASELSKAEAKLSVKRKYFIQVNVGMEEQKSGVSKKEVENLLKYCVNEKNLNIIGLMCIPPFDQNPTPHFNYLKELNNDLGLKFISMGMSEDYMNAAKCGSTHVRIGSKIFGSRSNQ